MDEQTILASEENFGNVAVCPGGIVHVNLVHLSLKLTPDEFAKLARLMGEARLKYEQGRTPRSKPKLQVVGPETDKRDETEKD